MILSGGPNSKIVEPVARHGYTWRSEAPGHGMLMPEVPTAQTTGLVRYSVV